MKGMMVLVLAAAIAIPGCRRTEVTTETTDGVATGTSAGTPTDLTGTVVDTVLPLQPPLVSRCKVGSARNKEGIVETAKTQFAAGEALHLTMWLDESPSGLAVGVGILDENGKEIVRTSQPADGGKVLTVSLNETLAPGRYEVRGYWGDNIACEDQIVVTR